MKILVVGGAGFIGHNVALSLEGAGHDVTILDSMTTYGVLDRDHLDTLIEERLADFKGPVVKQDITDDRVRYEIEYHRPEVVIHLASFPRAKIVNANPVVGSDVMVNGLINVIDGAMRGGNLKQFIFISSSMIYGDFEGGVSEDAAPSPKCLYATLKLAGEHITKRLAQAHDFAYTVIRPSTVYGPRDVEDRVVSKFIMNAVNNKLLSVNGISERLDFTYVDDLVDGIIGTVDNDNAYSEIFNLTHGQDSTILAGANTAIAIVGKGKTFITQKNNEMPSRGYLNTNKAKRILNYCSQTHIEEGFKKYYDWIKEFYSV